jgi:hypothetical protein
MPRREPSCESPRRPVSRALWYLDRFRATQREAPFGRRAACGADFVPEGSCDRAYPDAYIPPASRDLDCSDVDERMFAVLPPDPHNFDGDRNGIGCEVL